MQGKAHAVHIGKYVLQLIHFIVVIAFQIFEDVPRHAVGIAHHAFGQRRTGKEGIEQIQHVLDIAQIRIPLHRCHRPFFVLIKVRGHQILVRFNIVLILFQLCFIRTLQHMRQAQR